MVANSKQSWQVGKQVKVGFLSLTITAAIPTPGDGKPDTYHLQAANGTRYEFTPHHGLHRL